jgi:hypothetical protein
LVLTDKLDIISQEINPEVIDLIDEVTPVQTAPLSAKVGDLTAAELGQLIEEAVERALRKVVKKTSN